MDDLSDEQRRELLLTTVEQVVIDRENNVDITLAIPIDGESAEPASTAPSSA